MHNSLDVDVYLSIPSNAVIEHCSHIRFAAYPMDLSAQASDGKSDGKVCILPYFAYRFFYQHITTNFQASNHISIQDFSHIRSTPSPHWTILANGERIQEWPLSVIEGKEQLDNMLQSLLPQPNPVNGRASY